METLPLDLSAEPTEEALSAFLEGCRERAIANSHAQLVSISIESKPLDPLAVLESIYEPGELHFYMERRSDGVALAGAEAALLRSPTGDERFESANAFIRDTLDHSIAVGDGRLPFFGPHFFCGFTFFDEEEENGAFKPATIFVPKWQVSVVNSVCVASANALITADSDVSSITRRIWNAHRKFNTFEYASPQSQPNRDARSGWRIESVREKGGKRPFEEAVSDVLEEIESGAYEKIVLARAQEAQANQEFHPLEILNTLRERYPDCYAFSFANGRGQSFIGASPERLLKFDGGQLYADALAGSAPRGSTAIEDAQFGSGLLNSDKDRREHRVVVDSISRRLQSLGVETKVQETPMLKRLNNVQHLYNEIRGAVPEGMDVLEALKELHPSPAVGGSPRSQACRRIRHFESFDRGLYAGPIGWVNSRLEGEFLVAIRSALVDGGNASLYAGVGIVEGSVPENEARETDLKFKALLESLL